jgi:hypothetical protein
MGGLKEISKAEEELIISAKLVPHTPKIIITIIVIIILK